MFKKLLNHSPIHFAAYDPTNIGSVQGMAIKDSSADAGTSPANIPLSVVEAQVKDYLKSKALGVYVAATREQGELIPGGTAVYRIPELEQVQDYDKTNNPSTGPASGYNGPSTNTKKVQIDKDKIVRFELETLDLAKLSNTQNGEQIKNALTGRIVGGVSLAILAQVDADFLLYAITNADGPGTNSEVSIDIALTGSPTIQSEAALKVGLPIADIVNDMENIVDMSKIGVDRTKVFTIVQNKVRTRLIYGQNGYTEAQTRSQAENNLIAEKIAGIDVITHPFFDKNIAAGQSFDKDNAYDFSNVLGVIMHTEAIALPFAMTPGTATTTINPANGNQIYIFKYSYGIGKIRDGLITKIVKATPPVLKKEEDKKELVKKLKSKK